MGSKQLMCVNNQTFSSSKMSQMQVPEKRRFLLFCILASTILVSGTFFIGSAIIATNNKETVAGLIPINATMIAGINATKIAGEKVCQARCRLDEGEALPRGIVSRTSELEMRSLRGPLIREKKQGTSTNLLAIAAGIKQKESVNKIVTKFLLSDFVIMIFHYDGNVDDWRDLEWSSQAIHISAMDQTKWWFAKRFLHPDIISEYDYIFIWDEDIGVENFDVGRYLSIIKEEGLQISQPALDPNNSVVHHLFTLQDSASKVHRRIPDHLGVRKCDGNRTGPPCSGWVEIMVPVFSKTAWRCAWLLIQNDLIHGWGFDELLGYCVKGDRTQNIGIVDQEYVAHQAVPSLGDSHKNQMNPQVPDSQVQAPPVPTQHLEREEVMKRCFLELRMFRRRWQKAIYEDECWVDPY